MKEFTVLPPRPSAPVDVTGFDPGDSWERFCSDAGRSAVCFVGPGRPSSTLLSCRAGLPRPAASVLKLVLVAEVFRQWRQGVLDLKELVPRSALGGTRYSSLLDVMDADRMYSVSDLCGLSLAVSDNLAANYLFNRVGRDALSALLRDIGCAQTTFEHGFADADLPFLHEYNITTADDLVLVLRYLCSDPLYRPLLGFAANGMFKYRAGRGISEELSLMNKTGTLEGVVNDIGVVSDGRITFGFAFLCSNQSDTFEAEGLMAELVRRCWEWLAP